ncbi:TMX1 family protein [Megaselia abdita]
MWWKSIGILVALFSCVFVINANVNVGKGSASVYDLQELVDLNENNWEAMLTDEWMVEFFAPWCPACRNLQPAWERLAGAAGSLGVHIGKVDVTTSPSLSGRFLVTALPTIYHVKDGVFRQYKGSRDTEAFQLFLKQRQWEKIEPVSNWKQPDSIQMSVLSQLFKLSHVLKEINTKLYEEYGIPSWGCYALFTIATIFLSASLGLMLICVIDLFYPPKKHHRQSFSESKEKIEDIPNDEIEDDEEGEEDDEEKKDEEEDETSEGEKNSASEDSEDEGTETVESSEKTDKDQPKTTEVEEPEEEKSSPRELRKRKPRKAD